MIRSSLYIEAFIYISICFFFNYFYYYFLFGRRGFDFDFFFLSNLKEIKCVFFPPLFFFPLLLVCVCVWMKDQRLESRLSPCAVAERDNQKSGIISFVDFGTIENDVYA